MYLHTCMHHISCVCICNAMHVQYKIRDKNLDPIVNISFINALNNATKRKYVHSVDVWGDNTWACMRGMKHDSIVFKLSVLRFVHRAYIRRGVAMWCGVLHRTCWILRIIIIMQRVFYFYILMLCVLCVCRYNTENECKMHRRYEKKN